MVVNGLILVIFVDRGNHLLNFCYCKYVTVSVYKKVQTWNEIVQKNIVYSKRRKQETTQMLTDSGVGECTVVQTQNSTVSELLLCQYRQNSKV